MTRGRSPRRGPKLALRPGLLSAIAIAVVMIPALAAAGPEYPQPGKRAETQPALRAVFTPSRVQEGGLVTVEIRARGVAGAGAVAFHLVYDPTRLAPVEARSQEGGLFRRDGARTRFLSRGASTGDRVIVGLTRLDRGRGAEGSGIVARFVFRALAPGATAVAFDQAELSDPDARAIPARFLPGRLFVQPPKEKGRGR